MTDAAAERRLRDRILVLAPTRGDAELCRRFLDLAQLGHTVCDTEAALCEALYRPAGVLVVAEESLQGAAGECILDRLAEQPEWSALPILVLARSEAKHGLNWLERYSTYGRITLLQRPVRMCAFIEAVRLALRDRQQQYRIRDLLAERAERIGQRDEFLAMLGHELRNPLAAILVCGDVLETVPPGAEQARQCQRMVAGQARQIKRLLDDLLDFSRINRRKLGLEREPTDLHRVLEDVIVQVEAEIQARQQELDLDLSEPPVPVLADPMRLRQVFANLLVNANRYSPQGVCIRLRLTAGDGLARVTVSDNGAGLSEGALARIFDPFYQAAAGRNGSRGGLGIGLTLARSLVEMHAGTITAHSAGPGEGSEFVVTLPLHAPDGAPADPAVQAVAPARAGCKKPRRILLIEDNRDYASGLKRLLETRGHGVDLAHDGPDGIRAAEQRRPDVVLLDIGLPGIDGYEVARRLRETGGVSDMRLIAITGFGRATDLRRSRQVGIDRHLVKPVALPDLEAAIAGA